ncbi:hypothetical protein CBOM_08074 [Ceraceosorus bombacis]|uniref:Uncharacterized protein n=1 Tax=Ceraceosorus bombacis TaxID=401625 RepID=A0A0N7LBI5_9BASI|nr:hypothetical protein CBOM_08074 [Ceraceosorus bombacis]
MHLFESGALPSTPRLSRQSSSRTLAHTLSSSSSSSTHAHSPRHFPAKLVAAEAHAMYVVTLSHTQRPGSQTWLLH